MGDIICEAATKAWRNRSMTGNLDVQGDNRENTNLSAGNLDISGSNRSNIVIGSGNVDISKDNKWVVTAWAWTVDVKWNNWQGAHICVVSWNVDVWWNQGIITLKNWNLNIWSYLKITSGSVTSSHGDNSFISIGNSNINISWSKGSVVCINWDCISSEDIKNIKKWKKSKIDSNFSINHEISFDVETSKVEFNWRVYQFDNGAKKLWEYVFQKHPDSTVHIQYKWQKIVYSKQDGIRVEAVK